MSQLNFGVLSVPRRGLEAGHCQEQKLISNGLDWADPWQSLQLEFSRIWELGIVPYPDRAAAAAGSGLHSLETGAGLFQIITNLNMILPRTDRIPKAQWEHGESLVVDEIWKRQPGQRALLLETRKISKI